MDNKTRNRVVKSSDDRMTSDNIEPEYMPLVKEQGNGRVAWCQ